jgi:membrane-bound lytic murein transglycosylase D
MKGHSFLYRSRRLPLSTAIVLASLCLALCCVSCRAKGDVDADAPPSQAAPSAPVVTSVSRELIPANGGQTIRMPRRMGDAIALWGPLPTRQNGKAARQSDDYQRVSLSVSDIPVWLPPSEEDIMRRYLHRLLYEQQGLAQRVLARAENYLPIVREGVLRQSLPPELAFLPLVESAFEPRAVSSAGAAGLWQLMPDTARRFGLRVTDKVDERFNVRKATYAATAYLAWLYNYFGDWPLAIAAYNCGEGAMQNALQRSGCSTLAELTAYCRAQAPETSPLQEETLRFAPQFAAATIFMREKGEGPLSTTFVAKDKGEKGKGPVATSPAAKNKEDAPKPKAPSRPRAEGRPGKLVLTGRYDKEKPPPDMPTPPRIVRIPSEQSDR